METAGESSQGSRGSSPSTVSLLWAEAQDPLFAADKDPDGIGLDVLADNADAAHTAGHFTFLPDLERAVIDKGEAVVGGPGNAVEFQFDSDDNNGLLVRLVSLDHHVVVEACRAREERIFTILRGDGDDENRLGNLRQNLQGIGCGGGRAGRGIGLGLRGETGEGQAEQGDGKGQRFLEGKWKAWLHRAQK